MTLLPIGFESSNTHVRTYGAAAGNAWFKQAQRAFNEAKTRGVVNAVAYRSFVYAAGKSSRG